MGTSRFRSRSFARLACAFVFLALALSNLQVLFPASARAACVEEEESRTEAVGDTVEVLSASAPQGREPRPLHVPAARGPSRLHRPTPLPEARPASCPRHDSLPTALRL